MTSCCPSLAFSHNLTADKSSYWMCSVDILQIHSDCWLFVSKPLFFNRKKWKGERNQGFCMHMHAAYVWSCACECLCVFVRERARAWVCARGWWPWVSFLGTFIKLRHDFLVAWNSSNSLDLLAKEHQDLPFSTPLILPLQGNTTTLGFYLLTFWESISGPHAH